MSDTEMSSSAEEEKVILKQARKEKKEKKDKKDKKSSKSKSKSADGSGDDETDTPAKKRKRDILPDEIVVDVSLPEPTSKKAARAAKKAKLNPKPAATDADGKPTDATAADEKADPNKRSDFGVWIGNLPWSATKETLRAFLTDNTELSSEQITRIHLPPPNKPVNPSWTTKPLNRGFAYVDLSTELAMYTAIALTETKMDGRALLIKNAKSFDGRPEKPKAEQDEPGTTRYGKNATAAKSGGHPPNKRVFVGNLSFDVTKEDLTAHYSQCGTLENVHMATFEDSGKCKGYAWVTFGSVEAATCAVQGFIMKTEAELASLKKKNADGADADVKNPTKRRKWLLNKLNGRDLRCEFAEDSTTRYNKRYGKDKEPEAVEGVNPDRWKNFAAGGDDDRGDRGGRGGRGGGRGGRGGRGGDRGDRGGAAGRGEWKPRDKVDARTIKSGDAHMNAQRASQAIVEGQGKKTTFE